jgi:hypothetical protein
MRGVKRPAPDDWRRQGQERFLSGVNLVARAYRPYRSGWEHDHCEFCGAKFSCRGGDLQHGYSTEDGYHWICAQCFGDFRDEFGWQLVDDLSPKTG